MSDFVAELDEMIQERRKMTSPLYQTIMAGKATERLLQNFVIHRWPIKNYWTRHVLAVGARIDDHALRRVFVENAYEEETGALSNSKRHVETFADFGEALGVTREQLDNTPWLPETRELIEHNLSVCNDTNTHFTVGAAAVLLLMEGQPPIINQSGSSMMSVMRDEYGFPSRAFEFFVHHASTDGAEGAVSELEDGHAEAVRQVLRLYCTSPELRRAARDALAKSIALRHAHFDALLERFYDPSEPVFRYAA